MKINRTKPIKTLVTGQQIVRATMVVGIVLAFPFTTGCSKEDPTVTAAPATQGNAPPPVANRDVSHRLPPLAGPGAQPGTGSSQAGKGGE